MVQLDKKLQGINLVNMAGKKKDFKTKSAMSGTMKMSDPNKQIKRSNPQNGIKISSPNNQIKRSNPQKGVKISAVILGFPKK